METILKDHFIAYLNKRKPTEPQCNHYLIECKSERIDDLLFDIKDKEPTGKSIAR